MRRRMQQPQAAQAERAPEVSSINELRRSGQGRPTVANGESKTTLQYQSLQKTATRTRSFGGAMTKLNVIELWGNQGRQ
jgi:hypothetical protein